MKAREKYPTLIKEPKHLKKLLFDIARNATKDEIKSRKAVKRDEGKLMHFEDMSTGHGNDDEDPPKFEPVDCEPQPSERLLEKEKRHTLWMAIAKMPKKHAQIFLDLNLRKLKHHEVAKRHGLQIGSIGVYNKRAIQMLGVMLTGMVGLLAIIICVFSAQSAAKYEIQLAEVDEKYSLINKKTFSNDETKRFFGFLPLKEDGTSQVMINQSLTTKIQTLFGTNSIAIFIDFNELKQWTNSWSNTDTPLFKVVYDAKLKLVTICASQNGQSVIINQEHIGSDVKLPQVLPNIRHAIDAYIKNGKKGQTPALTP